MLADALHSGVALVAPILLIAAAAAWALREHGERKSYQRRMQDRVRDERDPDWRDRARKTDPRGR